MVHKSLASTPKKYKAAGESMHQGERISCIESPNSLSHRVTPWPNEGDYQYWALLWGYSEFRV